MTKEAREFISKTLRSGTYRQFRWNFQGDRLECCVLGAICIESGLKNPNLDNYKSIVVDKLNLTMQEIDRLVDLNFRLTFEEIADIVDNGDIMQPISAPRKI